jgi:hypothetical protein
MNNELIEILKSDVTIESIEKLRQMLSPEKSEPVTLDIMTIKGIIYHAQGLIANGVQKYIKKDGWEGIINGTEINEQVRDLLSNPAIIVFMQTAVAITLALGEREPVLDPHP